MKYLRFSIYLCLFLCVTLTSFAQRGKDGAKVINTSNVIVNEYNFLSANASAGATTISVGNSNLNGNGRFTGSLAPGDLIFIIQMQGVTIQNGTTWWNWGYIEAYNNCGYNEFAEVLTVPNSTTITLKCGLQNNYTQLGRVQVVRVPRYTSLTVNANDTLTCDAWNGTSGGIVVVEVLGNTVVNASGAISATGKGFRGGATNVTTSGSQYGDYASVSDINGAAKGESIAGWGPEYDARDGRYARGAPANGGGGGNNHNCGGGGGANGPADAGYGYTGNGIPDISTPSWANAWNLEGSGFATSASSGGGRGGYSFSQNKVDPLTVAPGNTAWGGTNRANLGGFGGRTLEYSAGRVYLGGGGGAGHQNNGWGGAGGNGGGIVYIHSYGSVSGTGTIVSNGLNGKNSQGSVPFPYNTFSGVDGSGGAGGGGTIYINTIGNISGVTLRANGGKGGSQIKTRGAIYTGSNPEAEGPGGGGGGGSITTHGGSAIKEALGGANGICDPTGLSSSDYAMGDFPPNGATKGAGGFTTGWTGHFAIKSFNDTVCQGGGGASLFAVIDTNGGWVPSGTVITWYDAQVGGNQVGTGNYLNIASPSSTVSYWVGTCPGTYRQEVKLVYVPFSYNAGMNLTICLGGSGQLGATGGTQYQWSPTTGLSNPNIADPIVTVTTNTKYYCTIRNTQGCLGTDSLWVYVTNINANAGPNKKICTGDSVSLTASGGAGFHWNTGSSNATIKVSPPSSQFYYVTVTQGLCSDSARVWVKVNPKPVFSLGPDTAFCQGTTYILNAGNPTMGHLWQDNSTNQTYSVTALGQGTYYCRVTDTTSCSTIDSVHINVVPNKNATITQIPPICSYSNPVTLNAAETGGVWSGTGITNPTAGTFNPATAGQGFHLVRYVLSGMCGDKDSIYIKVNAPPVVNLGPDTSICQGTAYILDAGNPTLSHLWQNSSTGQTFSVITSGTYYCRVTDTTSCFAADTAHIAVLPLKDATITQISPVCSYATPFNMHAAQTGGVWSGTGITNTSSGLFNPATAGAGLHLIKYVIAGQCGDRDSVYVKVNLPPIVNLGNDTSICNGTDLILNAGNPGMSYLWHNMSTAQTFTTNSGGTFYCKVTDTTGCFASDTIHITGITPKNATITPVAPVCMNIASFNIQAVDNGGTWTGTGISSASTGLFNPAGAGVGTHLIKYVISGQCGDRDSTNITVLAVPTLTGTATGETCMGKNDASINVSVIGGKPPYDVNWNTGQTTLVISNLIPGVYSLTLKDSNNCTVVLSENLTASSELCYKPLVYIPNVFSPNSDGNNDIFYVRGEGIKTLNFVIYDRWGEKVFESTNPVNGWDGTFKGKAMPAEIYYYKVVVEFVDGSQKTVAGDITLTR